MSSSKQPSIYQLRIELADIEPPIWRSVQVPSSLTLDKFHRILQATMGWVDYHLHLFEIDGVTYGELDPDDSWAEDVVEERHVKLAEVVQREGTSFGYAYDMGDGGEHDVELTAIGAPDPHISYPVCIDGARNCPPEDCGGPLGYENLLAAVGDPPDPEFRELRDWIGGAYDAEAFDLARVNALLRALR